MKKIVLMITLILALSLTGCMKPSIERAEKLVDKEKYDEAIEMYEELIDEEETNFDAWFGILDTYMEDDEYEDAADALKDIYEVISDNYEIGGSSDEDEDSEEDEDEDEDSEDDEDEDEDEDSEEDEDEDEDKESDVDYEQVIEDFIDYAEEIQEEESLGQWFYSLTPAAIELMDLEYNYEVGAVIKLEVPKGVEVYYNLDGKEVSDKDTKYKNGIELTEEGEFTLTVAAFNAFGKSYDNYGYFTVADAPDAPVLITPSGTYEAPLILEFENFDTDNLALYYTTDGSNPEENGMWYDPNYPSTLGAGDYQVVAKMYDYNSYMYSEEVTAEFTVTAAPAPTVDLPAGTHTGPVVVTFLDYDSNNQFISYTLDGSDPTYGYGYYPPLTLTTGKYTLKAIIYDYTTYQYSEILTVEYVIE